MHTTEQILERFDEKFHTITRSIQELNQLRDIKDFLRTALESVREEAEKKGRNDAVDYVQRYGVESIEYAKTLIIPIGILKAARSITNNK